jgi:MFS family permease
VWISYVLATGGMFLAASTSWMAPNGSAFSLPLAVFSIGLLLMAASYILGTPAWLGLTSLQVGDARQAQTLSLMQTAQGVGVVIGSALVASAGHVIGRMGHWRMIRHLPMSKLRHQIGSHFKLHILHAQDVIPITVWLWLACILFALCLVGTLLWVREPEHDEHAEDEAKSIKQPLEITGV